MKRLLLIAIATVAAFASLIGGGVGYILLTDPPEKAHETAQPGLIEVLAGVELAAENQTADGAVLLMPLPLNHGDQVPISCEITVDPPSAADAVEIYRDGPDNAVARITVAGIAKGPVNVRMRSVVLASNSDLSGVPDSASYPEQWPPDVRPWLTSTWCVSSEDPEFVAIGKDVRANGNDVMKTIKRAIKEEKRIVSRESEFAKDLTATASLKKIGSCTSRANLLAAILRASGVPARVLAGYPLWSGPLQTHYIVEAFVPDYGWYPIEPTWYRAPWENCRQINVSIVPPAHEGERAKHRPGIMAGVPYLSLTEYPNYDGSFSKLGTIVRADNCDHVARMVRRLNDTDPRQWKRAFETQRASWEAWLGSRPQLNNGRIATALASNEAARLGLADLASR